MNPTDIAWFDRIGIDLNKKPVKYVMPIEPVQEDDPVDLLPEITSEVA